MADVIYNQVHGDNHMIENIGQQTVMFAENTETLFEALPMPLLGHPPDQVFGHDTIGIYTFSGSFAAQITQSISALNR